MGRDPVELATDLQDGKLKDVAMALHNMIAMARPHFSPTDLDLNVRDSARLESLESKAAGLRAALAEDS